MLQRVLGILVAGLMFSPQAVWAQFEEDEDFPPGLLARYSVGDGSIERIDPAIAFDWKSAAPDARLPEGAFTAEWSGTLLVREAGTYRLHAYVQGEVDVSLDGKTLLSGKSPKPAWITGEAFDLQFGDKALQARFRKTAPSARVSLFWSSDQFPLEPLPSLLMYRDGGHPALNALEAGRILFAASRCNRCHQREQDTPAPPAPALTHLKSGTDWRWLVQKIQEPHGSPSAKMPDFGFSEEQAEQIAAYLTDTGQAIKNSALKTEDRAADAREGQIVFRSVGCLACHTISNEGQSGPFGGGDLSEVGRKRTEGWLSEWLKSPKTLNEDHRMPLVKLSEAERRQLAVFLSGLGKQKSQSTSPPKFSPEMLTRGKQLVQAAGCVNCHRINDAPADSRKIPDLSGPSKWDWSQSCLAARPNAKTHRPAYPQFNPAEREAIQRYVQSRAGRLSRMNELEQGRLVLERNNCLMCHERNHKKGIVAVAGQICGVDAELQGLSEALIPPALNAVGDKLLDAALSEAVSGEQAKPRLPWLKVRMPRFRHSPEEKAALLHYLISQDRVPDGGPAAESLTASKDTDHLVTGYTLVGPKGFSCVACHRVGEFEPRNVALGTRGSDLLMLGKRMRKSYFVRWTKSPQRIVPGMEMPSVRKAVPEVLGEDLLAQLTATWEALNDPKFTPPTSPTAVEQLLTVKPGQPARVVRDVFTNPKENGGGYIARALAIGLNNGHNLLFDLDDYTLRNWTFGDFARQRTEGKSWYWDLAGVPVMSGFTSDSDFALRAANKPDSPLVRPSKENNTSGRLISYQTEQDHVLVHYNLYFAINNHRHEVGVSEIISPNHSEGWIREIAFTNLPEGYEMLVAANRRTQLIGSPQVLVLEGPQNPLEDFVPAKSDLIRLAYSTTLKRPALDLPDQPEVTTQAEPVTSVPGYTGKRLPLPGSIMPTALAWTDRELPSIPKGTLVFTSLKGHLFVARDTDRDGLEDSLTTFEEGLAAPYGVLPYERGFLVAHKPEVVYLEDTDGDGRADLRRVVATGWGYSDNYHDWTMSLIKDSQGRFYVGLGSDYAQPKRTKETSRWRGDVVRITPSPFPNDPKKPFQPWAITPVGHAFRYPTGLAINEDDEIFVTDNQGVQNTFNEVNHLVEGRHYGVPSRHETNHDAAPTAPAIQVPHPWTRSVNGVFFLPRSPVGHAAFREHGIGCEYDTRFLIRFTLQKVDGEFQGAAYHFSRPNAGVGGDNFQGPLCGGVSPKGDITIGSIHDSGWLGGQNTGDIVRLTPDALLNNGIREVRATATGFDIEFLSAVDASIATRPETYDISGYTRIWKGGYATPDSGRHKLDVQKAELMADSRTVSIQVNGRREGHVYEISCGGLAKDADTQFFPSTAHYTLHRIPRAAAPAKGADSH